LKNYDNSVVILETIDFEATESLGVLLVRLFAKQINEAAILTKKNDDL